jgi:hypothetical protein
MTCDAMKLLPDIPKRGLSLKEAAEYCGTSPATISRYGPPATKIGKRRKIYDRRVIDRWLDQLSGLDGSSSPPPIGTSVERLFEARKVSAPQVIKEMVNTRRQARRRETHALLKSLRAEWRSEGK